jgi:hypothetical protein
MTQKDWDKGSCQNMCNDLTNFFINMSKKCTNVLFMMYYYSQTLICFWKNFMENVPSSLVCGPLWWLCPCFWTCIFHLLTFSSCIVRFICLSSSFKFLYLRTNSCNVRFRTYKAHPNHFLGPLIIIK